MKRCPFCAEEIQDAAIVCRFCGRDLPAAVSAPTSTASKTPAPAKGNPAVRFWTIALGVLVLAVLIATSVRNPRVSHPVLPPVPKAERPDARKRGTVVQELMTKGVIKRIDCERGIVEVNLAAWLVFDARDKENFTTLLASHCDDSRDNPYVKIIDAQSGRTLATFSGSGYAVK